MLYPGGVIYPSELKRLSRVCRRLCDEIGLPPKSDAGHGLAAHVLQLFMNGITEADELIRLVRNRRNKVVG
jgi:hypothetical protein